MSKKRGKERAAGAPMDSLWQEGAGERATGEQGLVIDVAGFEGPLDLLLHLARNQRVDLSRISVLALAEQYLQFVESARRIRIELAADYLVMAAWLAYLKSRLLIPQQAKDDGPSGEEMAATLAFRLKRLEAMRNAATQLVNRSRLGRDVFPRGAPEHIPDMRQSAYEANLYDLLTAYAALRQRHAVTAVTIEKRQVLVADDRRDGRLDGPRPLPPALSFFAPRPRHGDRLRFRRIAGNGARGGAGDPPGRRIRAALHAPRPEAR